MLTKLVCATVGAGLLLGAGGGRDVVVTAGWAGYVVRTDGPIESVRGAWVQPKVVCNRPESSAAFWVGLGGASAESEKLEQVGTSADCSASALVSHSAWYQLFPARAVHIPIEIRAGDSITAEVAVSEGAVTLSLHNVSTGARFSTVLLMHAPDTDSAEWIVEAPAVCFAKCARLPLADFGRVHFRAARATASGRPEWRRQRFELRSGSARAIPLAFSDDQSAFDVVRLARKPERSRVEP